MKIAILDDYAGVALDSADWASLPADAEIVAFDRHLSEEEAAVALASFDVLCTMRERMALPRSLIARLAGAPIRVANPDVLARKP